MPEEQPPQSRGQGPRLSKDEPLARALVEAIQGGDIESLKGLLRERPDLASARLVDEKGGSRTLLHIATDWPGFFPQGPDIVAVLIDAGGDPDAPARGVCLSSVGHELSGFGMRRSGHDVAG
jgi:hypothetical protein